MKWYFVDYFEGYTEQEVFYAVSLLSDKRKEELYKIYDVNLILKEPEDYMLLSANTMSLIKCLLIINRKNIKKEDFKLDNRIIENLKTPTFIQICKEYGVEEAIRIMLSTGYIDKKRYTSEEIEKIINRSRSDIADLSVKMKHETCCNKKYVKNKKRKN